MEKSKEQAHKQFGKHLTKLIKDAGYSSPDNFALSHGMRPSTIYRIIKGEISPTLSKLFAIADALEINPAEFFGYLKK